MPRIKARSIGEHHEVVWADLTEAMRRLLQQTDYDSINMGHIAARAGLARNTLYNYAGDKAALVNSLIQRAGRPVVERVTAITARTADPAPARLREIVDTVLEAFTDRILQLIFRTAPGPPAARAPEEQDPFRTIVTEVENLVQDGIARAEFRDVGDVHLTVELLSGVMRAGAERIGREPGSYSATVTATGDLICAALHHPGDR